MAAFVRTAKSVLAGQGNRVEVNFNERPPERVVPVLAVTPFEEDHGFLKGIFSHSNWKLLEARTRREALESPRENRSPVVISERDLPDGNWKDIWNELALQADPSPLIVAYRLADDYLWMEALTLGAFDVLVKPFETKEVLRVVSVAWRQWKQEMGRPQSHARATGNCSQPNQETQLEVRSCQLL